MPVFDWREPINGNLFSLRIVGLWPKDDEFYKLNPYSVYAIATAIIILTGHNLAQIINVFFVISDLEALTEIIFISITNFLATAKIYFFVRNMKLIKGVFVLLRTPQFQPRSEKQTAEVAKILKFWRYFYFFYISIVYVIIVVWSLNPVINGETEIYNLPFPAWYPVNIKKSPNYLIIYCYQVICIWPITIANINLDSLFFAFMAYIRCQFEILCDDLQNLDFAETYNKKLINCIKHHKKILRLSKDINNFFNMIVLGQIGTSTAVLALTMFQLSLVSPISGKGIGHLLYINGLTFQIFAYCKYGNEIEVKSGEIIYSVYKSNWIKLSQKIKKNILIFCTRCQRPLKISAINLFTLSLPTFLSIFRSAWSYFAVLHSVNAD